MMTANERRQDMLEYLCAVRSTTRDFLAERYKVSKRTIYVDILELSCSYPIYTKAGKGGGIYVEKNYYLHKPLLTKEQQDLLDRLKNTVDKKDADTLESIIEKFGRR